MNLNERFYVITHYYFSLCFHLAIVEGVIGRGLPQGMGIIFLGVTAALVKENSGGGTMLCVSSLPSNWENECLSPEGVVFWAIPLHFLQPFI